MQVRTVGAQKGKRPELPGTVASNVIVDQRMMLIHKGILAAGVLGILAIWYFAATQLFASLQSSPVNYLGIVLCGLAIGGSFIVARALFWLSFIGPIMLAAKDKAWYSQEELCRKAQKFANFLPAKGTTATAILIQSLVSRGKFEEAFQLGDDVWQKYGDNTKFDENTSGIAAALGLACQMQGDGKNSIVWNDRAIESFNRLTETMKTKKSLFAKVAAPQQQQLIGNINTQLTVSYFNNATSHFNLRNHRQAKLNYQKALETANQAPDFPEKADLVKAGKEQLQRLKHS